MFSSTIILTINRSTLSRAAYSVLDQTFIPSDFEMIVVNDSGQALARMDWQHSERVRVIDTNRRERSVARNTGAAIARGKYLHFLDDDDVLLLGALEAFWKLDHEAGEAAILYGSYRTVDNEGNPVEEIRPGIVGNIFSLLLSSESIPLQASFLRNKDFHSAGAIDSTVKGVEDRDLGRRVAVLSTIAYTPALAAQIRIGREKSTTNWAVLAEEDRRCREKAMSAQFAFARLRESADSFTLQGQARRAYWHGRVSRAYIASMQWNLKRGGLFIATSRLIAALRFSGWHILSTPFWQGLWRGWKRTTAGNAFRAPFKHDAALCIHEESSATLPHNQLSHLN
jgi:glycosyltransferase involved in cell wall biosynthesis